MGSSSMSALRWVKKEEDRCRLKKVKELEPQRGFLCIPRLKKEEA
jgi:hypothetical protein